MGSQRWTVAGRRSRPGSDTTITSFRLETLLFTSYLQVEKNGKWTQDVAVNKLKDTIEPKKQIYWQRTGRRLSEELVTGFSDARKKNFAVRNLTESELNFLLEYVCNS